MTTLRDQLRLRLIDYQIAENAASAQPAENEARNLRQELLDGFASAVLTDHVLQELLPEDAYEEFIATRQAEKELTLSLANQVANAMANWATARGATHYTHWFQPMTGYTAEKHDSFIAFRSGNIRLELTGNALVRGEPDASSFPSGGIRTTFEARGYTAWDMQSPAFLRRGPTGKGHTTLCIPTAFCSYTGETLDIKTPLLRSEEMLSEAAAALLRLIGEDAKKVYSTLGVEQEFFLIDRGFYLARPDLIACGRTLIGAPPLKGQELEDHYFAKMPRRVQACLEEVERELWELGVPSKTRHNEVAPSQYEMAPIFEKSPVATDHNMLVMEILKEVARRHGFVCLLHEKPFDYINGSGKHNNWSMATDKGQNLLEVGKSAKERLRFMLFLSAIVRAVHVHGDLLRGAITVPGNDHRLGANEAPPAIMSVFLGDDLDKLCTEAMGCDPSAPPSSEASASSAADRLVFSLQALPPIPKDTSDRNRTSPFAFTGNKFEFRAVGSSQGCAFPVTTINAIVADSLLWMAREIESRATGEYKDAPNSLDAACSAVIRDVLKRHYAVVFNGNNYSEEWVQEAERRGLPILRTAPEALAVYDDGKNVELFEKLRILSPVELRARSTVLHEGFLKHLAIEARALVSLAATHVTPAALQHQKELAESLSAAAAALAPIEQKGDGGDLLAPQKEKLRQVCALVARLDRDTRDLEHALDEMQRSHPEKSVQEELREFHPKMARAMQRVRAVCDELETIVKDSLWPLPKYSEMLLLS